MVKCKPVQGTHGQRGVLYPSLWPGGKLVHSLCEENLIPMRQNWILYLKRLPLCPICWVGALCEIKTLNLKSSSEELVPINGQFYAWSHPMLLFFCKCHKTCICSLADARDHSLISTYEPQPALVWSWLDNFCRDGTCNISTFPLR